MFVVHNGHMELRAIQSEDGKVQEVENQFLVLRGHSLFEQVSSFSSYKLFMLYQNSDIKFADNRQRV